MFAECVNRTNNLYNKTFIIITPNQPVLMNGLHFYCYFCNGTFRGEHIYCIFKLLYFVCFSYWYVSCIFRLWYDCLNNILRFHMKTKKIVNKKVKTKQNVCIWICRRIANPKPIVPNILLSNSAWTLPCCPYRPTLAYTFIVNAVPWFLNSSSF